MSVRSKDMEGTTPEIQRGAMTKNSTIAQNHEDTMPWHARDPEVTSDNRPREKCAEAKAAGTGENKG